MNIKCLFRKDHAQPECTLKNVPKGVNESLYPASTVRLEQSLRIGFIADHHISSKIIHDMLIESGHRVDYFWGVHEALPQAISGQYDLMLITRGKGVTTTQCEQFISFVRQQETPEIGGMVLVVVTELNNAAALERLFIAGASDVIVKPISEIELHNRLHQVIFLVPEFIFKGRRSEEVQLKIKNINEPNKLVEKKAKALSMTFRYAVVCVAIALILIVAIPVMGNKQRLERENNVKQAATKEEVRQPESAKRVAIKHHFEQEKVVSQAADPISIVQPKQVGMIKNIELLGRVVGGDKQAMRAKISGKIARVFVDIGERVSINQVIAVMESKEAVAELKNVQTRLSEARELLQLETDRYETVLKRYRQGQGNKHRLREAERSHNDAKLGQKISEDAYNKARAKLKNIRIIAQFDGVISAVFTEKNKRVNKGDTLFNLDRSSKKWIEVDLKEKQKPDVIDKVVTVFTNKNDRASTPWGETIVTVKPIVDKSGVISAWRIQSTLTKNRLRYGQQVYINLPVRD